MKFVLNTHRDDAGTRVCIHDLHDKLCAMGIQASLNDWDNYDLYDVVVFMAYDHEIKKARSANPNIKVVLADPKLSTRENIDAARQADLLLVSSVEQRDSFLRLNHNIFIFYMFPETEFNPKKHEETDRIVVSYHGNRVHLDAMRHTVIPALAAMAQNQPVELMCIYNIKHLGRADLSYAENQGISVKHIQWDPLTIIAELRKSDIGIMPNELPVYDRLKALANTMHPDGNDYAYEPFDHLVRYKVSANPGRLIPFSCAGLPVVADFCPSSAQFIFDGESGFLVSSPHGWHFGLSRLAESANLRTMCANKLAQNIDHVFSNQAERLVRACEELLPRELPDIHSTTSVDDEQKHFNDNPRPQETPLRWLRRQLKRMSSKI